MSERLIFPLFCGMMAVVMLLMAWLFMRKYRVFAKKAVRRTVKLVGFSLRKDSERPMVEVPLSDGTRQVYPAQPAGALRLHGREGESFEAMCVEKQVMGARTMNIFLLKRQGDQPWKRYRTAGIVFLLFGIALLIAGFAI